MDEIILKNEYKIPEFDFDQLIEDRKQYKSLIYNVINDFKRFTNNEREIYNKLVKLSTKNQFLTKEQTLSFRERDSLEFGD